jgi:hypothetical protein
MRIPPRRWRSWVMMIITDDDCRKPFGNGIREVDLAIMRGRGRSGETRGGGGPWRIKPMRVGRATNKARNPHAPHESRGSINSLGVRLTRREGPGREDLRTNTRDKGGTGRPRTNHHQGRIKTPCRAPRGVGEY